MIDKMVRRIALHVIGVALGAVLVSPAMAQQPQPPQQGIKLSFNLSPAGQAVAKRYLGVPNPQTKVFAERAAALSQRQRAMVAGPKLDMAQFAAVLRQQEQLQAQVMRTGNDRLLKLLGELSEADRIAFLKGLSSPTAAPLPPRK